MNVRGFFSKLSTNSSAGKYKVEKSENKKVSTIALDNCGTPVEGKNKKKNIERA